MQISFDWLGHIVNGAKGLILGQESDGYSRKWLVLVGAGLLVWKLPAITTSPAWHDLVKLALVWIVVQGAVDAVSAFKAPPPAPPAPKL